MARLALDVSQALAFGAVCSDCLVPLYRVGAALGWQVGVSCESLQMKGQWTKLGENGCLLGSLMALRTCQCKGELNHSGLLYLHRSGMLEAGVDRIISQVVDPKLNHIFRPQIERAIHEFLAAQKKEAVPAPPPEPEGQDPPAPSQDAS